MLFMIAHQNYSDLTEKIIESTHNGATEIIRDHTIIQLSNDIDMYCFYHNKQLSMVTLPIISIVSISQLWYNTCGNDAVDF